MLSFLRNLFYGTAGRQEKITQNGEVGSPPTNKDANRSKFSFLNMLWHGFFGRFFAPRMPERIEEGIKPSLDSSKSRNVKNGHQERRSLTAKTKEEPGFLSRKWYQWFGKGKSEPMTESAMENAQNDLPNAKPFKETLHKTLFHEEMETIVQSKATDMKDFPTKKCQYDWPGDTGLETGSLGQELETMNVLQKVAMFETMNSNRLSGSRNSSHSLSQTERDKFLPKVYKEESEKISSQDPNHSYSQTERDHILPKVHIYKEIFEKKSTKDSNHSYSQTERDKLLPIVYKETFDKIRDEEAQQPYSEQQTPPRKDTLLNENRNETKDETAEQIQHKGYQNGSSSPNAEKKEENCRRPTLKPNPEIVSFKRSKSYFQQLQDGVMKYGPLGIPLATTDYLSSLKSVTISIINHTKELHLTARNCFTKGCHLKGETLSASDTGSSVVFAIDHTNIKMAIRGVWAIKIQLADQSTKMNNKATLVIWWLLPVLSKNRFAVGIANSRIDADEKLYKQMKHNHETWFVKGTKNKVDKEFSNVLGKYIVTVSAEMTSGNRTRYRVEIY